MFLDINSNKLNVGDSIIFSQVYDIWDEDYDGNLNIIDTYSYLVQGEIISITDMGIKVLFNNEFEIDIEDTENNVYKIVDKG